MSNKDKKNIYGKNGIKNGNKVWSDKDKNVRYGNLNLNLK